MCSKTHTTCTDRLHETNIWLYSKTQLICCSKTQIICSKRLSKQNTIYKLVSLFGWIRMILFFFKNWLAFSSFLRFIFFLHSLLMGFWLRVLQLAISFETGIRISVLGFSDRARGGLLSSRGRLSWLWRQALLSCRTISAGLSWLVFSNRKFSWSRLVCTWSSWKLFCGFCTQQMDGSRGNLKIIFMSLPGGSVLLELQPGGL